MILDTNALSAFFEGDARLGAKLSRAGTIFLPVVVLGEYRFGLLASKRRKIIEPALDKLEKCATVLHIEVATVRPYAEIRNHLKKAGKPIPSNDLWIAALAVQHGLPLVSRDAHFDEVPAVNRLVW